MELSCFGRGADCALFILDGYLTTPHVEFGLLCSIKAQSRRREEAEFDIVAQRGKSELVTLSLTVDCAEHPTAAHQSQRMALVPYSP